MKLTALTLIFCAMQISASTILHGQNLNLQIKNESIRDVLKSIEKESSYRFFFNDSFSDLDKIVQLDINNGTLAEVMDKLLSSSDVSYKLMADSLIVIGPKNELQQKKVTGTVTDAKTGEPMPGVNVLVEGTTTGVSTDAAGKYSITAANEKSVLVFSFIGYEPFKQAVGARAIIDVQLVSVAKALDEVVVIGYGTARKKDLTSSISTVKFSDVIKSKSITSVEAGLQGLAAGVQVTTQTTEPGSGLTVRVRGMSSISAGNDPLYVIDGVPFFNNTRQLNVQGGQQTGWLVTETAPPNSGMSAINPNDIESIQVLKDASATAIYGNRGANGVVLITTKRGQAGHNKINFDMSYGWQNMVRPIDVLESKDVVTSNHELLDYYASLGQTTVTMRLPDTASNVNTNWQKAATIRNAPTAQYNLSFSGGNQNITYYVSGNYQKQDGIVYQTGFNRRSIRANLEAKISEKFNAGVDMSASYGQTQGGGFNEGNIGTQYYTMSPVVRAFNSDGTLNNINPYTDIGSLTNTFINPIRRKDNPMVGELNTNTLRALGNMYLSYKILKDLTIRSSYGLDYIDIIRTQWGPKNLYSLLAGGSAYVSTLRFPSYVWENRLNYDKTINDHTLGVTLAQSIESHNKFSILENTYNFNDNILRYYNMSAGANMNPTQSSQNAWQLASFIGRINYSFKSKYLASVSLRADGSSKFANKPWGYFPAVSAAWKVSEEPFIKDLGFINDLKIRGGWGATGNDDIDPYGTVLTYGVVQYPFGGISSIGVKPNNMPYPDLTWEKTYMSSGGIDLSLFKERISLTAEYYYKKTVDLLLNVNIPSISGFNTMLANVGSIQNKGVDLSLETHNLEGKFSWTTKINFSANQNKVLKLTGATDKSGNTINYIDLTSEVASVAYRIQEGHSLGEFYDYVYGGVFKDAADVKSQKISNVGPGSQKYMDLSGPKGVPDSIVNDYDKRWIGNPNPKFFVSMENRMSYKGVTLSFFINCVYGNTIMGQSAWGPSKGPYLKKYFDKRWSPTNTDTDIPRVGGGGGKVYWDGSFARLQYLTLSYDLPSKALARFEVQGLRVFVTGQNLFLLSNYGGYDPEVSSSGNNALMQGIDRNGYPGCRTWMIGINLQF